jgi:DNA-binding GntR family transcriptional regulator
MARSSNAPLRNVIADAIRSRIMSGHYVPGTRLREEELAADFDVSRVPVREALQVLEQERFLELRKYRGAVVALPASSGIRELIAIRAELEGMAARLAAGMRAGDLADELQSVSRQGSAIDPARDPDVHSELVERFHDVVARASGNRELVEMLRGVRGRLSWMFGAELAVRAAGSWDDHRCITQAILNGDVDAGGIMRAHVLGDVAFFEELVGR